MKIIRCENYGEMSARAAEAVAEQIEKKPDCVLGLATGSTPEGMYECLTSMYRDGKLSFGKVTSVNLDEYYPIAPDNTESYRYFMNSRLFDGIDIDKSRTYVPDGMAADPEEEGRRYEGLIASLGGIDIQVLGIGRNGHIGFNEPGEQLYPDTHITDLTESTINANARFFASENDVPKRALTMGIGTILRSKKIILMASGPEKKEAVMKLLGKVIDTGCPATLLNLHSDVTLICTNDAID